MNIQNIKVKQDTHHTHFALNVGEIKHGHPSVRLLVLVGQLPRDSG